MLKTVKNIRKLYNAKLLFVSSDEKINEVIGNEFDDYFKELKVASNLKDALALACSNNYDMMMLLQIHDELIFEVKEKFIEEITRDLKEIMENVYKLNIPLKVSVSIGNSWQELK